MLSGSVTSQAAVQPSEAPHRWVSRTRCRAIPFRWCNGATPTLCRAALQSLSSPGTRFTHWFRYVLYTVGLAALMRLGRPPGLASAPYSLIRSCLIGCFTMTSPF